MTGAAAIRYIPSRCASSRALFFFMGEMLLLMCFAAFSRSCWVGGNGFAAQRVGRASSFFSSLEDPRAASKAAHEDPFVASRIVVNMN
jgi:hypothetical protein